MTNGVWGASTAPKVTLGLWLVDGGGYKPHHPRSGSHFRRLVQASNGNFPLAISKKSSKGRMWSKFAAAWRRERAKLEPSSRQYDLENAPGGEKIGHIWRVSQSD